MEMNRTHCNVLSVTPIMYRVKVGLELTQWLNTFFFFFARHSHCMFFAHLKILSPI